MDWKIRSANTGDVDALALVGAATFLETFAGILDASAIVPHCQREHGASAYQGYLDKGAAAWLAEAANGGAPIGFALVAAPDLPGANERDLELKRIYTLSRFHGSGLGKALMAKAVEYAQRQGATRLVLGVYGENRKAIGFYEAQGFEQIATRKFQVGERQYDDVVLARNIAAGSLDL